MPVEGHLVATRLFLIGKSTSQDHLPFRVLLRSNAIASPRLLAQRVPCIQHAPHRHYRNFIEELAQGPRRVLYVKSNHTRTYLAINRLICVPILLLRPILWRPHVPGLCMTFLKMKAGETALRSRPNLDILWMIPLVEIMDCRHLSRTSAKHHFRILAEAVDISTLLVGRVGRSPGVWSPLDGKAALHTLQSKFWPSHPLTIRWESVMSFLADSRSI